MSSQSNGNIFEGGKSFDWASYMRYRPDYIKSGFYRELWDYHTKSDNSSWDLAYDVGSGPGQVAETLASKFKTVVASDVSNFHVEVARDRLSGTADKGHGHVECVLSPGETMSRPGDEGKVDMITAGESLALMDTKAALSNFARHLKPGGTFACWYYGGPIYLHDGQLDSLAKEVRDIHRRITSLGFDEHRPFKGTSWVEIWTIISAWLDNIEFPNDTWTNIHRVKHNTDFEISFINQSDYDFKVEYKSKVKPGEEVLHKHSDIWRTDADSSWAKGFINAMIPRKGDYITKEVEHLYAELEKKMEGKKFEVIWPVVCIMATRK